MAKIKKSIVESVSIGAPNGGVQNGLKFSCSGSHFFPLKVTFEPITFKGGYRMIFEDSYNREEVKFLRDTLTEILTQTKDRK